VVVKRNLADVRAGGAAPARILLLRETDGRRIGDVPELPGVTVYGATPEEATLKAKALALRVNAEEIEHGEMTPAADRLQFSVAE
jgi:predicted RNase H-like HicB family nuclease